MISRTSNQVNFKGNLQGVLRGSEIDARFFPQEPIKLEPQTDIVMLAQITNSLKEETAHENVQTMISHDGKTLSFSILPQFYREKVGDPFAQTPIELYDQNILSEHRLRRHDNVQLIRYSLSQEEYKQGIQGMNESAETLVKALRLKKDKEAFFRNGFRLPSLPARLLGGLQDGLYLNLFKGFNRLMHSSTQIIIKKALPEADHAKLRTFFRG